MKGSQGNPDILDLDCTSNQFTQREGWMVFLLYSRDDMPDGKKKDLCGMESIKSIYDFENNLKFKKTGAHGYAFNPDFCPLMKNTAFRKEVRYWGGILQNTSHPINRNAGKARHTPALNETSTS